MITPTTLLAAILAKCIEEEGSATAFAAVIDVQPRTLLDIVASRSLSLETARKIGEALGVTAGEVVDWHDLPVGDAPPFEPRRIAGLARIRKLTPQQRRAIALLGAKGRWRRRAEPEGQ